MSDNSSTSPAAAPFMAGKPGGRAYERLREIQRSRAMQIGVRIAVVLIALAILYLRTPNSFTNPQFWGEDIIFFDESRAQGWGSLVVAVAGWLAGIQFIVACLATYANPIYAPTIYNAAAILLTLSVVWIVTSPRLDLPYKILLAIAVVVVPMGFEEVGTLTNIQWILPVGAIALMFMRPSDSRLVRTAELIFVALTDLSGPFAIFLAPLFFWQFRAAEQAIARRRLLVFTIVTCLGAACQILSLTLNPAILTSVAPVPFDWTVWVNLPFTQWMTTFGAVSRLFEGVSGVVLGVLLSVIATLLAFQQPYQTQKLFMLFFSSAIVASGMYKFRDALGTQFSSQRYFYFGSVFALWFICCLSNRPYLRSLLATSVALIELALLPVIANTPRVAKNLEWPVWASYLSSGLPTLIPSSPDRFYLNSPATPTGPLARFAPWLGRDIRKLAGRIDPSSCSGSMDLVAPLPVFFVMHARAPNVPEATWITRGMGWDAKRNRPVQLIVLVDAEEKVVGFGFPGFQRSGQSTNDSTPSGWISIFYTDPGKTVRAYGIVDDGQSACPLDNERYFPLVDQPLASTKFLGGAEILPGKAIVQRLKPKHRVEAISIGLVTWGKKPTPYLIDWTVVARVGSREVEVGSGKIDSTTVLDWQLLNLALPTMPSEIADEIEVTFRTGTDSLPVNPIGVPLYQPLPQETTPPANIGEAPSTTGGLLGLQLTYGR